MIAHEFSACNIAGGYSPPLQSNRE